MLILFLPPKYFRYAHNSSLHTSVSRHYSGQEESVVGQYLKNQADRHPY